MRDFRHSDLGLAFGLDLGDKRKDSQASMSQALRERQHRKSGFEKLPQVELTIESYEAAPSSSSGGGQDEYSLPKHINLKEKNRVVQNEVFGVAPRNEWDFHIEDDPPESQCSFCCPGLLSCLFGMTFITAWVPQLRVNNEQEAVLALNWGKFAAVKKTPGIFCLNPFGMTIQRTTLKQRTIELRDVRLIDSKGNPVIVGGAIFWKVVGVKAALLEVQNVEEYIQTSGMAILKNIVSRYPYEDLKREAAALSQELSAGLQERLCHAGVKVISFNMTDLSYAPEIAQAMLVRQQAEAMVKARKLIVKGAVDISEDAISSLKQRGIQMTESERAHLLKLLLTVICAGSRMSSHDQPRLVTEE